MKPIFNTQDLERLQQVLQTPKKIAIIGHVAPDGDALGSSLAMSRVLGKMGHETTVLFPTIFSKVLDFLPGANDTIIAKDALEKAKGIVNEAEILILMDLNEPYRVESLQESVVASKAFKVLIDHHPDPSDFVDISFSYPELSSTCLLTYHLINALGWCDLLDKETAECIYVGMMTDTGFLTYNSGDPSIYETLSHLLQIGIEKDALTAKVTRNFSINKIKLNAFLLHEKLSFYPEYKTTIITLSMADKRKFEFQVGDTEGLVNEPLAAKEVEFSIFLQEMPKMTKVSMRSKGDFPTNEFAKRFFNGGGHLNASGAELHMPLSEALELVTDALSLMHP